MRHAEEDVLSDDCNTCDLLGATAKGILSGPPLRVPSARPGAAARPPPTSAPTKPLVEDSDEAWAPKPAPGIVEIGNAGWTTIHSFAAYYPDKPTEKQRESAKGLIEAFTELFPCRWCADDLKEHVQKFPVKTESRAAFSQWTCDAHNHVNEHLGKPLFDCSLFDTIWRRHKAGTSNGNSDGL
jgi:FAD-linked sulfhydryl oxidase